MGLVLRIAITVAAAMFIAPFAAMLAEPFYAALLDGLGIDSSYLGRSAAMLVSAHWFQLLAVGTCGAAVGAWLHWLAAKLDRRRKPLSDAEAVLGAAVAVANLIEGRLRYVREVLDENKPADLKKWREKVNFQRIPLGSVLAKEGHSLTAAQDGALRDCEVWFEDLDSCINNIVAGKGYKSNAHAAGLYRDRAAKCQAVLMQLIAALSPEEGRARERKGPV